MTSFAGMAHVYGDHIDTDRIIPGKYTKTLDVSQLAAHVLEDLDPTFHQRVRPGDILVVGLNFGCGSSREQAPLAIQTAGITAVIATSFARIFFRNAINIGLPVIEIGPHTISSGAHLEVDLANGQVTDVTNGRIYQATQLPQTMIHILQAGGLVNYLKTYGGYGGET